MPRNVKIEENFQRLKNQINLFLWLTSQNVNFFMHDKFLISMMTLFQKRFSIKWLSLLDIKYFKTNRHLTVIGGTNISMRGNLKDTISVIFYLDNSRTNCNFKHLKKCRKISCQIFETFLSLQNILKTTTLPEISPVLVSLGLCLRISPSSLAMESERQIYSR